MGQVPHDRTVAPLVLDGPINGAAFTAWIERFLVPPLAPGDVVILDNLGSHKGRPARQAIRKAEERTIEATWRRVGKLLEAFSPHEYAADLRHAGHASAWSASASSGSAPGFCLHEKALLFQGSSAARA